MKCERIYLACWIGDVTDGYVDIPWPEVHNQVSAAVINWLNQQDPTECQIIVDKEQDGSVRSLWAEFYNKNLRLEYALRFGQ